MSAALVAKLGQIALNLIVDVDEPLVLKTLKQAYGLGTEIGVILSTHPADEKRIAEIEKILQDQRAQKKYERF